jgi:hypothetical protein
VCRKRPSNRFQLEGLGGDAGNRTRVLDLSSIPSLTCVAGLPFRRGFPVSPGCPPRKSRPSLLRLLGLVQSVWLAPRGYSDSFPVNGRTRFRRLRRPRYRSQLTFAQLVKAGQALLARSEIPSLPSRSQSSPCCLSLQAASVATTFRGSVLAPFMTRPNRTIHQRLVPGRGFEPPSL